MNITGTKDLKANLSALHERIVVLSDGTGETAETFVKAILAQFNLTPPKISCYPSIGSAKQLTKTIQTFKSPYLVAYTFASEKLRKDAWAIIRDHGLTGLDLLYPAVEIFSNYLKQSPTQKQGAFHTIEAENYFSRIEAIEYTVKHDDGMRLSEIEGADLILTGVSRTSKTPTSIYLAHRGYKVANVPLIPGIEPPAELLEATRKNIPIVFLMIEPSDLERIRKTRFQNLGQSGNRGNAYIDSDKIREELKETRKLAKKLAWPMIDVTDKAIEETASEILLLVSNRGS